MSTTSQKEASASRAPRRSERRGSMRCKFTQLMRIRPSNPETQVFDDLRGTLSVSRTGIYFHTTEMGYEIGMRLFVTMPYTQDPSAPAREYLAEVVRKDPMNNGMTGIGIKILLEMNPQNGFSFASPPQ